MARRGAGALDRRLRFESRQPVSDGAGNTLDEWLERMTLWGKRSYLRGGESVLAARLESRQPVTLSVRNSTTARQIGADWRAVDVETGEIFNLRENPKLSETRGYLDMLAEGGVPA